MGKKFIGGQLCIVAPSVTDEPKRAYQGSLKWCALVVKTLINVFSSCRIRRTILTLIQNMAMRIRHY